MLLELYRLGQLHVLHKAIYMSLHCAHLYGSTHSSYILDRFMGAGGGVTPCVYCIRIEWVATAADSLTSLLPLNFIGATPMTPLRSRPRLLTSIWPSKAVNICRLKRPQLQGQSLKEMIAPWNQTIFDPSSEFHCTLSVFYSTSLSLYTLSFFFPICASASSLSSSPATSCMYIYKSAHNWCLGKSKEQRGREAIRGIKRGAASQPSFTGQWSKSNWVLFGGRTHTYVCTLSLTRTHTHIYSWWQCWSYIL